MRSAGRLIASVVAIDVLALGAILALDLDISAAKYLKNDVLFRSAVDARTLAQLPYDDASGLMVWLPSDHHLRESLKNGELPLWNRKQGGGFSPVGHFQHGVFSPLRMSSAIFPARYAESALIVLALGLAFIGMMLVLISRELSTTAALFGAAVYALGTHSLVFTYLGGSVFAFLPWTVFAYFRLADAPSLGRAVGFAVSIALLFLAGHPLYILASLVALALVVLAHVALHPAHRRAFSAVLGAGVLGVAFAAFALQPFLIAVLDSWSYKTESSVGIALGAVSIDELAAILKSVVWWPSSRAGFDAPEHVMHLGIFVCGLTVLALIAHRERRWLFLALPVALLLAIPGPWLAAGPYLPALKYAKPTYLFVAVALLVAWAAALGVEVVLRWVPARWLAIPLAAIASVPLYLMQPVLKPERTTWVPSSAALQFLRAQAAEDIFRITGTWGQIHVENISALTGIEDLRISAPMLSPRYHLWMGRIDPNILRVNYPTMRRTTALGSPLFGGFNVRYVIDGRVPFWLYFSAITPEEQEKFAQPSDALLLHPALKLVFEDESVRIFENILNYKPRAYYSRRVLPVLRTDLAAAAMMPGADVVEGMLPAIFPPKSSTVAVEYPSESSVVITAEADRPGLVVLNDLYEEGWEATIDGEPAPIYPVNLVARGVVVPAGRHRIEMVYWPPGLKTGALISGLAVVIVGLLWARKRRTR